MFQFKNAKILASSRGRKVLYKRQTPIYLSASINPVKFYIAQTLQGLTRAPALFHLCVPVFHPQTVLAHNPWNVFGPSDTTSTLLCNLSQVRLKVMICSVTSLLLYAKILYFALSLTTGFQKGRIIPWKQRHISCTGSISFLSHRSPAPIMQWGVLLLQYFSKLNYCIFWSEKCIKLVECFVKHQGVK